jgi:predicted unusual protein kinase regulating ubiquinone biosynthesis (AarF/ABC1/UbiB family)
MNDQWARVLDDWASSFWLEMDYTLEASHAMAFQAHMEQAGLAAITTAQVNCTRCARLAAR